MAMASQLIVLVCIGLGVQVSRSCNLAANRCRKLRKLVKISFNDESVATAWCVFGCGAPGNICMCGLQTFFHLLESLGLSNEVCVTIH